MVILLMNINELKKIYDNNYSPSKTNLYNLQREQGLNFTKSQVNDFVDKQEVQQLMHRKTKPKDDKFNSVISKGVGDKFQVDLLIYDRYELHHYKYILNCIDIYSRYAYGVALTNKKEETIIESMKEIIQKFGLTPNSIFFDNGKEFIGNKFKEEMKKLGVNNIIYTDVNDIRKNSIIERFNGTIALLLQKWRITTGKNNWYKVLPEIYDIYNNNVHRTIQQKPIDVFNGTKKSKQIINFFPLKLDVGDIVRIKIYKKTLDKGDIIKFSKDTYKIKDKTNYKYILEDKEGHTLKKKYTDHDLIQITNIEKPNNRDEEEYKNLEKHVNDNKLNKKLKRIENELGNVGAESSFDRGLRELNNNSDNNINTRITRNKKP